MGRVRAGCRVRVGLYVDEMIPGCMSVGLVPRSPQSTC